ncbi:MAG TPA: CBS domain-containing protein [Candidatus Omnitrophota bacterium]|nr:CBS domain-containing protein [Candidatus Omnitrophota bacterium]HPS37311.1 CBS domain-containing protein [Candidatus Omnitrophota bacterium]
MMKKVPLKDLMVTKVITLETGDLLSKAEEKFRQNAIRHLPVVDEKKRLVGMFTHRDLARCMAPRKTEEGYVYDKDQLDRFILRYVMTADPVTLGPDDTLGDVIDIMARNKYGCIPIVNKDGVLAGIVTQIDVLKYLSKYFEKSEKK